MLGARHLTGQSYVGGLTTSSINGGGAGRAFLPEAVSARMRKRRCFADTELDVVMLERERAHAVLTRRAAAAVPQQPVAFRLPATPYQLQSPGMTCRRPDEPAMRLIHLIRSWWTPPSQVSEAGIPTTSFGCRSDAACNQPSKSSIDVSGTFSRQQPLSISGLPLPYTGSPSTLGRMPTPPPFVRATTADREDQRPGNAVVNQTHTRDHPSTWTDTSTRHRQMPITRTHRNSEKEPRRLESKSLRTTKTFDFSVESLLAK